MYNKEIVSRILSIDADAHQSSFVDLIFELKPVFLNTLNSNKPTMEYIHFMKYLISILESCSLEQLKTIERFCLRMDEDAVTGIVKYHNHNEIKDEYKTYDRVSYLFKKYKISDGLLYDIIKRDHINISNTLIAILATHIRVNKPLCKYSHQCYRKNNDHLKMYLH